MRSKTNNVLVTPNSVIQGDCLEVMPYIEAGSIDMILADLPYGTTACKWDSVIPFEPLWKEYKRIIKPNGAIVLTASQPFTSVLVMSNPKMFKYEWVWKKSSGGNFLNANRQPLKRHESIIVFGYGKQVYNPIKTEGKPYKQKNGNKTNLTGNYKTEWVTENNGDRFPVSVLEFKLDKTKYHPTQKPIALFEYLIKTYSNEGDLILDNTCGSGTTAIAAINTNRNFILMEKDPGYFEVAKKRIEAHYQEKHLDGK